MEIRINKSAITQYLLIYLMFIIPGSCLFAKYWTGTMKYFVLLIVYAALIAFKNKYRSRYSICFLLLLLFFTVFSRFLVGGVGLSAWYQFAVCILSTQIAIEQNRCAMACQGCGAVLFLLKSSGITFHNPLLLSYHTKQLN